MIQIFRKAMVINGTCLVNASRLGSDAARLNVCSLLGYGIRPERGPNGCGLPWGPCPRSRGPFCGFSVSTRWTLGHALVNDQRGVEIAHSPWEREEQHGPALLRVSRFRMVDHRAAFAQQVAKRSRCARRVLNGIYWRLGTGSPWADIPERDGPCTIC